MSHGRNQRARRDDFRRNRTGRLGLDGDTLMGPDWFKQQADLAVEEADMWPEETARNRQHIDARDKWLARTGLACIVAAVAVGALFIIGAIWAGHK